MTLLEDLIKQKKTFILTMEKCPDTVRGLSILYANGIDYEIYKKEDHPDLVEEIIRKYSFKYYPTIFIKGNFIGGDKELETYLKKESEIKSF